jgi:hypothetical protein
MHNDRLHSLQAALIFLSGVRTSGYYRDLSRNLASQAMKQGMVKRTEAAVKNAVVNDVAKVFNADLVAASDAMNKEVIKAAESAETAPDAGSILITCDWNMLVINQQYRTDLLESLVETDPVQRAVKRFINSTYERIVDLANRLAVSHQAAVSNG